MGKRNNDAYAGTATMPNRLKIVVKYLDKAEVRAKFGWYPAGHPQKRRIGWYWFCDVGNQSHGPFTSSRLAMQDALGKNREAAA